MAFDDLPIIENLPPEEPQAPVEVVLETRDLLDKNGNVVGLLSYPVGTPEAVWTKTLAIHTYTIPNPTLDMAIGKILAAAQAFGAGLIAEFKVANIKAGISQANKTKEVSDYCHKMNHYLEQGSLYAAIQQLDDMVADANRPALALEPFITTDNLTVYKVRIAAYLGIII